MRLGGCGAHLYSSRASHGVFVSVMLPLKISSPITSSAALGESGAAPEEKAALGASRPPHAAGDSWGFSYAETKKRQKSTSLREDRYSKSAITVRAQQGLLPWEAYL